MWVLCFNLSLNIIMTGQTQVVDAVPQQELVRSGVEGGKIACAIRLVAVSLAGVHDVAVRTDERSAGVIVACESAHSGHGHDRGYHP